MKRIMVIGCGGAGKSTLSRRIGDALSIPVFHLDSLYWSPGWVEKPKTEWICLQEKICSEPKWIIDGNYGGSMALRLAKSDTVIFLDFSTFRCLYRVVRRFIQYRGRTREDMTEGCEERLDGEFLRWIWNFRKTKPPEILKTLSKLEDSKQIIVLSGPREVSKFLSKIQTANKTAGGNG